MLLKSIIEGFGDVVRGWNTCSGMVARSCVRPGETVIKLGEAAVGADRTFSWSVANELMPAQHLDVAEIEQFKELLV